MMTGVLFGFLFSSLACIAQAQNCAGSGTDLPESGIIIEYVTDMTADDLTNSRDVRLTEYRAILQQDLCNHHKQGVRDGTYVDNDAFEPIETEAFFTARERRQLITSEDVSLVCPIRPDTGLQPP